MNNIFLIIFAICPEATAETIQEIYPMDPYKILFNLTKPEISEKNLKWTKSVFEDENVENFLNKIIEIPNVLKITPINGLSLVDNSPFCWIILTYNSKAKTPFLERRKFCTQFGS